MAIVLVACSRRALALAPRFPRAATRPRVGALHGSVVAPRMQRASALSATIAPPEESAESEPSEAVELPTNDSSEKLLRIRHSCSHVMAMAVQRLYPGTQVTIGPWIENGFYYDFYRPEGAQFVEADLKSIQKEMVKIMKKKLPFDRVEVSRARASELIERIGEPFKLEILDGIQDDTITIYTIGGEEALDAAPPAPAADAADDAADAPAKYAAPSNQWWDLCAGPHVEHTGEIPSNAFQLTSVAGAYWRGDETRPMLQRIYATAWESKAQLKEHQRLLEEAKKRDHRVLGKQLGLFSIQEDAGGGLVFWHPKGATVRRGIEDFWKDEHVASGYELLVTPHVANIELWKTSGHFDFYKEGMFDQMDVEGEEYQIKPMNCPFHCLVFKDELRSYRELPLRWAELGTVYRYERSGTLHGLFRVRGFTQDDAHIFCLEDQLEDELVGILDLTETILTRFGFDKYDVMLSTRPEKSVGSDEIWDAATSALRGALERKGWGYAVDEGGGAFYGPKIDLKIRDAIGRQWQCSTVQCDFNLPERFDLEYVASDQERKRPVMVHRAIFGSLERFFGVLIESTAGELPLWLAPTQLRLLPVTDAAAEYCADVKRRAAAAGVRAEVDAGRERLGKQIRNAEKERVPLVAVVGEREVAAGTLAIRSRAAGRELGGYDAARALAGIAAASQAAVEFHELDGNEPDDAPEPPAEAAP